MKLRNIFKVACMATCVLMLGSCSLDDILDQSRGPEIAFRPALGTTANGVRAGEFTANSFNGRDLIVTAVNDNGEYYFKDVVFKNSDPSSAHSVYVSDEKYYWPGDGSPLHFTAYPADYETRGILNRATGTISYKPMTSWYTDEYKAFDGSTVLPGGTIIKTDGVIRLPDGETVDPDGTIHFHGNATLYPDKRVELENGDITIDIYRNITLLDGTVINRAGIATLPNGLQLYPNGIVKYEDSSFTRTDVGAHTLGSLGTFTVNDDGSVAMPDGSVIPAMDAKNRVSLPSDLDIFMDSQSNVFINYDATIDRRGDIDFESGDKIYDYLSETAVWIVNSTLDIYLGGNLEFWSDGYSISPSREVSWITERNNEQPHEDIVVAHSTGSCADIAGMPLNFSHKLSQIEIWAKNANPNYQYEIVSVKIANVKGGGTISLDKNAEWDVDELYVQTYQPGIEFKDKYFVINPDNGSPYHYSLDLVHNVNTSLTDPNLYLATQVVGAPMGRLYGSMMLLPQELTPWDPVANDDGTYLAVKLKITTPLGAKVYPVDDPIISSSEYAWVAVPLSGTWQAGKRYVYNLDFSNGAGYSDPDDPNPHTHPHLVLNGLFDFSVTVSDWTTGHTNDYPVTP